MDTVRKDAMPRQNGVKSGRPRIELDHSLLLRLRTESFLGWSRMAREYQRQTGQWVSKETVRRRYTEATENRQG